MRSYGKDDTKHFISTSLIALSSVSLQPMIVHATEPTRMGCTGYYETSRRCRLPISREA